MNGNELSPLLNRHRGFLEMQKRNVRNYSLMKQMQPFNRRWKPSSLGTVLHYLRALHLIIVYTLQHRYASV